MSLKTTNDYTLFLALKGGYFPSDQELKSDDENITYSGFENRHGEWFIEEEDVSTEATAGTLTRRYAKGDSGYAAAWIAREAHTYNRPSITFN